MTPDELAERLLDFAVRVGKVVDALPATRLGRHIASQLVRSGTSPGPNYEEGCAAESRADFVHKLSICQKRIARIPVLDSADREKQSVVRRKNVRTSGRERPIVQNDREFIGHCKEQNLEKYAIK